MKTIVQTLCLLCASLMLHAQAPYGRRPQTPVAPYPYRTEEVQFVNPVDSAVLSGTLTYPVNYDSMPTDSVRVVLMVTGSGQQNRDEEMFGHKPFLVMADYFARHGIASLRYDDRGFGKSTGDVSRATTRTFLQDASSGVRFLNSLKKFGDVGVLGHSEGAMIALMPELENCEFVIALAAPTVRGDKLLVEQNRQLLKLSGASEDFVEDYCRVLAEVFRWKVEKHPAEKPEQVLASIIQQTGANLPPEAQQNLLQVIALQNAWMDNFLAYDPETDIAHTCCRGYVTGQSLPVLALYGGRDVQVPARMNMEVLQKHTNPKVTVKEYPELNHLFQHCLTGHVAEYAQTEETFSEEVLQDMVRWMKGLRYRKPIYEAFINVPPMPEFPGGTPALMGHMTEQLRYPEAALADSVKGRVFVRFIVDEQGTICFPKVIRPLHPLLDAEALRFVRSMPRWKPALMGRDKRPARCLFTLPVIFKMPEK